MRAALLLALVLVAGCLSPAAPQPDVVTLPTDYAALPFLGGDGLYHYQLLVDGTSIAIAWAPGALSTLQANGTLDRFSIQSGGSAPRLLLVNGSGIELPSPARYIRGTDLQGTARRFLPAPSYTKLLYDTGSRHGSLDPVADGLPRANAALVSGYRLIADEEYQEAHFPHRTPGQPNYALSQAYFADRFRALGLQVEVDPYGTDALPCLVVPCPASFANVVATKPGTGPHKDEILFVAGGHYDMVAGTVHAAFDNTAGTVGTLELARALANFTFDRTLMFALWGGEESGTLGSEFWVKTHPDALRHVVSYWNLDVIGMSWPAHAQNPSPIVVAAGPDVPSASGGGATADPVSQQLLAIARTLQRDVLGYPDQENATQVFRYEGVDSGEVAGGYAGINAQSDHASFTKAGIPAWFIFNGDTVKEGNPMRIHSPHDTLANMTRVSLEGADANLEADLSPVEEARGRQLLAHSFEATLWFPFYATVFTDLGVVKVPSVAGMTPSTRAPSGPPAIA